jgi:predicted lipoprotein with Yx(FWY)xxD motif
MRDATRYAVLLLLSVSASVCAQPPAEMREGILVDGKGRALYTFDKDAANTSSCYAQCSKLWPPLYAPAGALAAGAYTLVKRRDGRLQWAHKGRPLYYWLADTRPGQATGEAVEGWHLVR